MAEAGRRETFYEAQGRHRRSGWRFSLLSAVAVVLLGLPLSVVVSPFVSAAGLIALDVVDLVVPMPDPGADIGRFLERLADAESAGDREPGEAPAVSAPAREVVAVAVALLVPGMLVMVAAWLCMRRLFLRAGAGAVVLAAGARPPRPGDLEERQLVNLVEEMALAAGVRPPRVMILDADIANAAVVGRSIDDATLIVPRRMLVDLGRRPTGALVADLLAMVVNGDLRIALVIASVFQTFDLVGAALTAPFSRRTRQVLAQLVRLTLRPRSQRGDGTDAHFIAVELAALAQLGDDEEIDSGCLVLGLQFPFLVASIAFSMTRLILGGFVVAPAMAALWRRRRLLADATAVELTRDPDALARALEHLQEHGATVPAGPWTHLFVVGPELARERSERRLAQRREEIWNGPRRPGESRAASVRRRTRTAFEASSEFQTDAAEHVGADDGSADLVSFIPPIGKRIDRLVALGAEPRPPAGPPSRNWPRNPLVLAVAVVIVAVLVAILLVIFLLLLGCLAAMIYLALLFEMVLLAPPVILVHVLLR
jgi:Zn-dependent protease with chaperone function